MQALVRRARTEAGGAHRTGAGDGLAAFEIRDAFVVIARHHTGCDRPESASRLTARGACSASALRITRLMLAMTITESKRRCVCGGARNITSDPLRILRRDLRETDPQTAERLRFHWINDLR